MEDNHVQSRTVLVIGANGFLGNAVARAFSFAGWRTYGLVRRESSALGLWKDEVFPIVGSSADPVFVNTLPAIDVIVSTTEDRSNYHAHFNDNISLFKTIANRATSDRSSIKPLVIFTSGCKDYGMTRRHGDPELRPHTEEDPLNGPTFLRARTELSKTIFDHKDLFDAVLMRPTTFYGRSGTYYAPLMTLAQKTTTAAGGDGILKLRADPNSIMHGTHIDDVANAYVAVAEASRDAVAGEAFNMSSRRYETAAEVARALEKMYGISVELTRSKDFDDTNVDWVQVLMDFTQWVSSEKLRGTTGWKDRKPLFTEDLGRYGKVLEAYVSDNHEAVLAMNKLVENRRGIHKNERDV